MHSSAVGVADDVDVDADVDDGGSVAETNDSLLPFPVVAAGDGTFAGHARTTGTIGTVAVAPRLRPKRPSASVQNGMAAPAAAAAVAVCP